MMYHEAIEEMTGEQFTILVNKDMSLLKEEVSRFKATHNVTDILLTWRTNELGEREFAAVITYEELED